MLRLRAIHGARAFTAHARPNTAVAGGAEGPEHGNDVVRTVVIDALNADGAGVCAVDGKAYAVPSALPGETVNVRLYSVRGEGRGELRGLVSPSPARIAPRCALFGVCAGCQLQHLAYADQLEWKRGVVRMLASALARPPDVHPTVPSPAQYGYRSKLTPHFTRPKEGAPPAIGFARVHSRRVLDVPHCPIAEPVINEALPELRARADIRTYPRGATFLLRGGVDRSGRRVCVTEPTAVMTEAVGGLRFSFIANAFFQNNPFALPGLLGYVLGEARTGLPTPRHLVDAYCGAGLFSIAAAPHFETVVGIDISQESIQGARFNARANGAHNCRFEAGDAAAIFASVRTPSRETTVILDPSRKGCDESFLSQLLAYGPARVVYVSCNPATQMRDVAALEHAYDAASIQPFDLFPNTSQIESVVTLVRRPP